MHMGPGGQDKDLIYQAHVGTTVLDALRCAPPSTGPPRVHQTQCSAAAMRRSVDGQLGREQDWVHPQALRAAPVRMFVYCKCRTSGRPASQRV